MGWCWRLGRAHYAGSELVCVQFLADQVGEGRAVALERRLQRPQGLVAAGGNARGETVVDIGGDMEVGLHALCPSVLGMAARRPNHVDREGVDVDSI